MHDPHAQQPILTIGAPLEEARGALILLHGRGDNARGILYLAGELAHDDLAYLAPQAANNSWYPHSFLKPIEENEPHLSSALHLVDQVVQIVEEAGIPTEKLFIGGFSQGACLTLEYVARYPRRYGGVFGFSGGLIGLPEMKFEYEGTLAQTPIFLGCSDNDPHIPAERVKLTAKVLEGMGATVDMRLYPNMGHTIVEDEIVAANAILRAALAS